MHNPVPLTFGQLRALARAAARELTWGLREATRELSAWRRLAETMPAGPIRDDALYALRHKRGHADGAALFSVLPDRRNLRLLQLLVAYETILDFLDNVSERHPEEANGRELHYALSDALDPDVPVADYYRYHPWQDDGGYLVTLVEACRGGVASLPSYARVRDLAILEARRNEVLALNHLEDGRRRDRALMDWARREHPNEQRLEWFELTSLASSTVQVLALLVLASEADLTDEEVARTWAAYWPWMGMISVMLDSYADQEQDAASGDHSYVAHYADEEQMAQRLCQAIAEAAHHALRLPNGTRHTVILGCMVALYLSKDSARGMALLPCTRRLARAGGSLTCLLLPILRAWRLAYSQRSD
jgi:tetraprenyl-beta-curcumene synthase